MNTTKRSVKDFPRSLDLPFMNLFLGKNVNDFCNAPGETKGSRRFKVGDSDNHCAHWVSHVLGFRFGSLCASEKWHGDTGRTLRVDELFHWCPVRGKWETRPKDLDPCLIFATVASNVITSKGSAVEFGQGARKHVGIWLRGQAFNYHNGSKGKEGVNTDGDSFFKTLYGKTTVCYYGTFPK